MNSKLTWIAAIALSVLWAGLAWAGYHLVVLCLQWLGLTPTWLNNFPEVQALLFWLTGFTQGLESIVAVLTWLVWGVGQLLLLGLLWLGLKLGANYRFSDVLQRLRSGGRYGMGMPHDRWRQF